MLWSFILSRLILDYTIDNQGKYTVIFGCIDLIRKVVNRGDREVHADVTLRLYHIGQIKDGYS